MIGRIHIAILCIFLTLIGARAIRANDLAGELLPLIEQHAGHVAVAVKHLGTGEAFEYRADEPMPTASLIKVAVMVEAYRQAEEGSLALEAPVPLRDEDKVPGSGILTDHFSAGTEIPLRDAIRLMIAFSDNTATNLVIDRIGLGSVSQTMEQMGFSETKLHSKVFRRDTSIFPERSERFGLGSTTAAEIIGLLERLHGGQVVSRDASEAMTHHLRACQDRSMLARYLPSGVRLAHKTGAVNAVRCDAGIAYADDQAVALCVLTCENQDQRWSEDNAAERLCAQIGRRVYEYFGLGHQEPLVNQALGLGASGQLVAALQRTLNARLTPSPNLAVDGQFGPLTHNAVKAFQRQADLTVNGQVDGATWKALGTLIAEDPPVPEPDEVNGQTLPRQQPDALDGPPLVTCAAWAVADGDTGEILWSHNADQRLHPASTTKIMTALVVLELARERPDLLDQRVTFSATADATMGSSAGLIAGECISVRQLLYGLLLPSGNDAAVALAESIGDGSATDLPEGPQPGGRYPKFIERMNQTAQRLGLSATTYRNPHGLTDEAHLTTAADLVRLAFHAIHEPLFCQIVGTRQYGCRVASTSGYERNVMWKNTNRLLEIEGFVGIKTGTTDAAGACLVSYGTRDGRALIVAVLGSTSPDGRYVDTRNLFRWAWQELKDGRDGNEGAEERRRDGGTQGKRGGGTKATKGREGSEPVVVVTPQAAQLHQSALVFDGHNDLPWRIRDLGMPSFDQFDIAQHQDRTHTDIPRLRAGGVDAQFWSVYVPASTGRQGTALLTTLEQIELVHRMIERYADVFELARTADDVERIAASGKIASLIGVEGGHSIENSLSALRQLYDRGARYMTLTHSETLDWADSATDQARLGGLSPFGEEVVRQMNRLGMLVDLSHVSVETMLDALQISQAPIVFSHSSARSLADHPRNVPDEMLKLVRENGGVVMVNFYPGFVVPAAAQLSVERWKLREQLRADGLSDELIDRRLKQWDVAHPLPVGSVYDVVNHIEHIAKVAGVDHVGLGSDFDGIDTVPRQLEDVAHFPYITQLLLDRGFSPADVRKILGQNVLRVLRQAEQVADRLRRE